MLLEFFEAGLGELDYFGLLDLLELLAWLLCAHYLGVDWRSGDVERSTSVLYGLKLLDYSDFGWLVILLYLLAIDLLRAFGAPARILAEGRLNGLELAQLLDGPLFGAGGVVTD